MTTTSQPTPIDPGAQSAAASGGTLPLPKTESKAAFLPTPGAPGFFQSNFDFQLVRAMCGGSYGEGAPGECYATARRIVDVSVDSWTAAWSQTAERNEVRASRCLEGGHVVSAREAFLRASHYWKTAWFYLLLDDLRVHAFWERHRDCFLQAARLFTPPIEPVSIPYEHGKTLPGYFMKADASLEPRPTLLIIGGGDTTCEEMYFWGGGAAVVGRGYNALLWEGPGQVGTLNRDPELVHRPDWEVPAKYVVDYVLSRPDVDPDRLALSGHSMGGYFAPRAVAFEKRIKAVIGFNLLPDLKPPIMGAMGLNPYEPYGTDVESKLDLSKPFVRSTAEGLKLTMGLAGRSLATALDALGAYNLWGLEKQFTCPVLNVSAAGEGQLMRDLSLKFLEKLTCPKTDRYIEGDEGGDMHCMVNNPTLKHQIEFDWLDDVFGYRGA